jgi:acetate kinase
MTALVLVVNAGSSSLKYRLMDPERGETLASGLIEKIEEPAGRLRHATANGERHVEDGPFPTFERALQAMVDAFEQAGPSLRETNVVAVGHRVVHGGDHFAGPTLIDDDLVMAVAELVPLAPLHNPANLAGIEACRKLFPRVPQVAVFDTAFHQTMPPVAYTYAVPAAWRQDHKIRRYGFHGTSHRFVAGAAAALLERDPQDANLIVLHLGNGASATAVRGGASVDTSMGLTPLEGLVMGTRSGDLDPAIHAHLHRELGWSLDDIDHALNHDSGLKGLCGHNDSREVEELRAQGDAAATLAFDVFCYRIRKYVGAYYAVLGRVDAVVFTAGIGERSPETRAAALAGLERLGIFVDEVRNSSPITGPTVISRDTSEVAVLVVPTDEEWEIARQALSLVHPDARTGGEHRP